MHDGTWDPSRYRRIERIPFFPTETEIDQLISGCSHRVSVFLQLLKETGIRSGEAWRLKWTDTDFKSDTIRVTPGKGSKPRIFHVSNKLIAMLNTLPRSSDKMFTGSMLDYLRRSFERQRRRIAFKLGNPRLKRISFHTMRHWKGTTLYHQTKDVLYVMQYLGHRNINNTLKYIQLETALFKKKNEDFICKIARNIEETKSLIELGFDYVCDVNEAKMFRKRK